VSGKEDWLSGRANPFRTETYYFFEAAARFDALSGLSFCACSMVLRSRWVAKLQSPRTHFVEGLGATAQNVPSEEVTVREQPWQVSTTGWQRPPLKLHPFLVMNAHSIPFFKVIHCIVFPPALRLTGAYSPSVLNLINITQQISESNQKLISRKKNNTSEFSMG
jgi:hypothetical protein